MLWVVASWAGRTRMWAPIRGSVVTVADAAYAATRHGRASLPHTTSYFHPPVTDAAQSTSYNTIHTLKSFLIRKGSIKLGFSSNSNHFIIFMSHKLDNTSEMNCSVVSLTANVIKICVN